MTAATAKTKHRKEWTYIHECGCNLLHINPEQEIPRFVAMSKFISDFTDFHHLPPRTRDLLTLVE